MIASKPQPSTRNPLKTFPRPVTPKTRPDFASDLPSFKQFPSKGPNFKNSKHNNNNNNNNKIQRMKHNKVYGNKSMRHSVNLVPSKFGVENRSPNRSVLNLRTSKSKMSMGNRDSRSGQMGRGKGVPQWKGVRASGNYGMRKRSELSKEAKEKQIYRGVSHCIQICIEIYVLRSNKDTLLYTYSVYLRLSLIRSPERGLEFVNFSVKSSSSSHIVYVLVSKMKYRGM